MVILHCRTVTGRNVENIFVEETDGLGNCSGSFLAVYVRHGRALNCGEGEREEGTKSLGILEIEFAHSSKQLDAIVRKKVELRI